MYSKTTPGYRYYFWVGLLLVLVFTALEPAGTQAASLTTRVLIWALQIGMLLPLLIWVSITLQAISLFNTLKPWLKLAISGLIGSIIFVPAALAIDFLFGLDNWSGNENFNDIIKIVAEELIVLPLPIVCTWIAINVPLILRLDFSEQQQQTPAAAAKPSEAKPRDREFLSLIPKEIGDDIIYLKAELHYVRVVTPLGERLVLFNFGDSIAALEHNRKGLRTHRSYWVAASHIRLLKSEGGRDVVLTDHGHTIPVSRRKREQTRTFIRELPSG